MGRGNAFRGALAALAFCIGMAPAAAQDAFKVAAGQRGNWDTSVA